MPQVIFSRSAIRDLARLREFVRPNNPSASERAANAIIQGVQKLGELPHIGRPIDDLPEKYRELLIEFGESGYIARYRIDGNTLVVLAIRHQKEAGF
ncbi:MAG: type II toxin-antitoxin system RelE/ParE family toxin [Halomonas sp.]|uniref:type II toxin-antitoxin system RelE/ParE family toxin n=1 Tax=Halomonas sp. TaxID=1486246 RepID=UPI002ACD4213|nr:type II toxin-antitoxin system RelE/ParE family toxin [Halomonas sp.]MDZ7852217.1 type II toxin-antitoxin system RelE/ParE family toxin [Halomonas sp.]